MMMLLLLSAELTFYCYRLPSLLLSRHHHHHHWQRLCCCCWQRIVLGGQLQQQQGFFWTQGMARMRVWTTTIRTIRKKRTPHGMLFVSVAFCQTATIPFSFWIWRVRDFFTTSSISFPPTPLTFSWNPTSMQPCSS